MKKLTILLLLSLSMSTFAQIPNFDAKQMQSTMFSVLNDKEGYRLSHSPVEEKIYRFIKKSDGKISADEMIKKINQKVARDYMGIFNQVMCGGVKCVGCKHITTYQEVAERCNKDWSNPSDAFFRNGWGKNVIIVSYYNNKTDNCYVYVGFN